MSPTTFREMNLAVFRGEAVAHPLFQPRFEPWYEWHRIFNQLPEPYWRLSLRGLYADLGVSMRYMHYYTGMPNPVAHEYAPEVQVRERIQGGELVRIIETPLGELEMGLHRTQDETWRTVRFAVRRPEDLRKLRWLYDHTTFSFSAEAFARGDAFVGDLGEPQFWVPKSPYQALAQIWMKLPDLIYALADCPDEVEATMAAIDAAYDRLYEGLTSSGCVRILNLGENLHQALFNPRYFERYLIPWYEKRCGQLRRAGIYTHVHLDGYFHTLLPYLKDLPFDGYEALTPKPQGDVELEEIKEHSGNKVLLDGIPAVLFLPSYSREELMACAERVVRLFHPRLVLGVSDEVPEGAGVEAIERVRMVSEWCRRQGATVT
ncbi:MAG: uroporphyrinogen decarboxylase family protein [Anaerolineae bacterium]